MMEILVFVLALLVPCSHGFTDPRDVSAINSLYIALENPPLPGWIPNGGDPCFESWLGVECVNSNITGIILNGANLGGELSTNLDLFTSMIVIDLSNNHIGASIPINLPLTMRNFSLSGNHFTGSIPGSLSLLSQLTEMSLNNNHFSGEIPDIFQSLMSLVKLDLYGNNFSGPLPPSMGSLLSLTILHLQDNHLSGTLDVLQDLSLLDLNIENNIFSGPIPAELLRVPDFKKDGNPFNTTIIPLTPPSGPPLSPPPLSGVPGPGRRPGKMTNSSSLPEGPNPGGEFHKIKKLMPWAIPVVVVLLIICFGLLVIMLVRCMGTQRVNKLANQKGGSDSYVDKSQNMELLVQCNKTTVKGSKGVSDKAKDWPGMASPRMGVNLNQMHNEKQGMGTGPLRKHEPFDKTNTKRIDLNPNIPIVPTNGESSATTTRPISVTTFTVASLQQYTSNFSQENLIGKGTLGKVYRAELPSGKLLAVKKLDNTLCALLDDQEFLDLVKNISKLQNDNVLELEGYCVEHRQRLLVYRYCSNGSLHDALHSHEPTKKLSWNSRIQIALGAARALEYLHEICHPQIVHHNLKSANILLDDELAVRLSDCGLDPLISLTSTSQLSGFSGYEAPEFEMGLYSCQSNVFSFGVVLLELLTGQMSYDSSRPRVEQFLVRWAIPRLHDIDALCKMVDPSLNGTYPAKSLSRYADIISMCIQSEPEFRPPMSEIVQNLLSMIQSHPPVERRTNGN